MRIPWNKGKKGVQVAWNKGKTMPPRGPMSEEEKLRRSRTMTGRIYSEERRAAMRGPRKPLSEEHKAKIRSSMKRFIQTISQEELDKRIHQLMYNAQHDTPSEPLSLKTVQNLNVIFEVD